MLDLKRQKGTRKEMIEGQAPINLRDAHAENPVRKVEVRGEEIRKTGEWNR